jgi:hypothetical protein
MSGFEDAVNEKWRARMVELEGQRMSVLNGPTEGDWSVFAEKVVAERDAAMTRVMELTKHRAELQELCTAQITKIRELDEAVHQRNDRIEYVKGEAERIAHDAAKDYVDMRKFQAAYIASEQRLRAMELAQAEVDYAVNDRMRHLELENASLRSRIALLELEAIDPEGRR